MSKVKDLIVVSLLGNLGNQLFQFAAAKGLQRNADCPVIVDSRLSEWPNRLSTVLKRDSFRDATQAELLRLRQVPRLSLGQRRLMMRREVIARTLPFLGLNSREFRERGPIEFDPAILERNGPVLLRGYFQNEEYFAPITDLIRRAFAPPPHEVMDRYAQLTDRLTYDRPVVGISLRTGIDYQSLGVALPLSYYEDAIDLIQSRIGPASFVIFGDVAEDCTRFTMSLDSVMPAVAVGDMPPACQLHLMAMLPHLILSNSSFAWWAAWLGDQDVGGSKTRVVVAPTPWWPVAGEIAPARWIQLDHAGLTHEPGATLADFSSSAHVGRRA